MAAYDVVIIGGGLIGSAIGFGLVRRGLTVAILDEGDDAFRASRGNLGLVWFHGKGDGHPAYARWTRRSADLWPEFARCIEEAANDAIHYQPAGGLELCLDEEELRAQAALIDRMRAQAGDQGYDARLLDRTAVRFMVPGLGDAVVGGVFSRHGGHVNPLRLLRALHQAFQNFGGHYRSRRKAGSIESDGAAYAIRSEGEVWRTPRVVIAAGLDTTRLAAMAGMTVPVAPQRGHLLVTERLAPFLDLPTGSIRQTVEGTVLMGDSHESVGLDSSTNLSMAAAIGARAVRTFPFLSDVQVIRSWACLRVLTPDGLPIYAQSPTHPGISALTAHSGVTLAAAHALDLAPNLLQETPGALLAAFSANRFHVPTAA